MARHRSILVHPPRLCSERFPMTIALRSATAVVLAASCAFACPAHAQDSTQLSSVLTYRTVRVAEGIYAFITPEERTGFQSGNSIVVIGNDAVLVFDTGNIPAATRRQIAEI